MVATSVTTASPSRTVDCEDALPWLERHRPLHGCSFVTSLPDISELGISSLDAWRSWFVGAAEAVLRACPDDGVSVFYQTDIKRDGTWVDKAFLCQWAAQNQGSALLWHKVVCRAPPGQVTFGRPAYAHVLCFSKGVRADPAHSTADVLLSGGDMTWNRAIGLDVCAALCRYVLERTSTRTIVDPFCGVGTVLAMANALGLDARGVELHRKRADRARVLRVVHLDRWRVATDDS